MKRPRVWACKLVASAASAMLLYGSIQVLLSSASTPQEIKSEARIPLADLQSFRRPRVMTATLKDFNREYARNIAALEASKIIERQLRAELESFDVEHSVSMFDFELKERKKDLTRLSVEKAAPRATQESIGLRKGQLNERGSSSTTTPHANDQEIGSTRELEDPGEIPATSPLESRAQPPQASNVASDHFIEIDATLYFDEESVPSTLADFPCTLASAEQVSFAHAVCNCV
jgi:hypothetical protein